MLVRGTSRRNFFSGVTALVAAGLTGRSAVSIAQPLLEVRHAVADDEVDLFITHEMSVRDLAGLAIAVVQYGKLVKARGYGVSDLEQQTPVSVHTRFHLDSLSKLFTAVAVMQLVEAGAISLEDPISRWLDGLQPTWSGITIRHLLTHSSGIVDDYAEEFHGSMLLKYDTSTLFEHARTRPLEFRPGERAKYNNLGFFLLTLIIERASGMPSQRYIEERVLRAADMTESSWPSLDDIVPNLAQAYVRTPAGLKHSRDYMASQAGFSYSGVSTVLDLVRFTSALDSGKLLKPESIAEMEHPFRLSSGAKAQFGLGWELASYRGHPTISKGGSSGALLMRFPDRHLTVIILGNVAMDWPVGSYVNLVHTIAGHFDPLLARPLAPDAAIGVGVKVRLQRAFESFLRSEEGDEALSPAWEAGWPVADRRAIAAMVRGQTAFEVLACDLPRVAGLTSYGVPVAKSCAVSIRTNKVPVPLTFTFHLDRNGKVAVIDND
jgi:D-alanyl-D-alanine carboxypeptidase